MNLQNFSHEMNIANHVNKNPQRHSPRGATTCGGARPKEVLNTPVDCSLTKDNSTYNTRNSIENSWSEYETPVSGNTTSSYESYVTAPEWFCSTSNDSDQLTSWDKIGEYVCFRDGSSKDIGETAREMPLLLNFDYQQCMQKESNKPILRENPSDHSVTLSLPSNDGEADAIHTSSTLVTTRSEPDFRKFIPIPEDKVLSVPKLLLNEVDPKELQETKQAMIDFQYPYQSKKLLKVSSSESSVLRKSGPRHGAKIRLGHLFACGVKKNKSQKTGEHQDHSGKDFTKSVASMYKMPERSDERFDFHANVQYCQLSARSQPNFTAVLYAELPTEPNFDLCHVKTELAVAAMLNFFHPWNDVQCHWIRDIHDQILELTNNAKVQPKFTRLVHLRRFQAMLVLSEEAGVLLRHRNMCFIYSLAAALQVSHRKILILVKTGPK